MNQQVICSMSRIGKIYPNGKQVLKNISLSYFYGAKIGVLGLNGSGKSTLLKIMAGVEKDFIGEFSISKGYTVGYLEQEPALDKTKTVKDIVSEGVGETIRLLKEFDAISEKFAEEMTEDQMNDLLAKQSVLQDKLDTLNAWDLDSRLQLAMDALGCPPADTRIEVLSGGEKRRVALCRLLLQEPDILLLDEPTNHLDAQTVHWLERHLQQYPGTVIAVTHDRYFLDNVAGWILELDRGEGIPWKGNYSSWLEQKTARLNVEEKQENKRTKALQMELEWIRSSPKARQAKSKARVANYEQMFRQTREKRNETHEIMIPPGPRLGDIVINVNDVAKSYDHKTLYQNLNFQLPAGGVVGIIGPNGAGKSTLFKMFVGQLKPDKGSLVVGETVKLSYVDQNRELNQDNTIFQEIAGGRETMTIGNNEINSRAYIARFNFAGSDHNKKVTELSGGERNRVHLAKLLQEEGNVLLLDEPTNDLDVNTLRALEEAIQNFAGCAVVISHDRYFLDRIATHILAFEKEGPVWFDGNYSDYQEDRKKRLGDKSDREFTYTKLVRA